MALYRNLHRLWVSCDDDGDNYITVINSGATEELPKGAIIEVATDQPSITLPDGKVAVITTPKGQIVKAVQAFVDRNMKRCSGLEILVERLREE